MAFGKRKFKEPVELHECSSEDSEAEDTDEVSKEQSGLHVSEEELIKVSYNSNSKPLLEEVTICGAVQGKNSRGSKSWQCKHCKIQKNSSYTRIHHHFFGPPPGKKAGIQRCFVMMNNRIEYEKLRKSVQEKGQMCVSILGILESLKQKSHNLQIKLKKLSVQ